MDNVQNCDSCANVICCNIVVRINLAHFKASVNFPSSVRN
jgi:hypothetical protein